MKILNTWKTKRRDLFKVKSVSFGMQCIMTVCNLFRSVQCRIESSKNFMVQYQVGLMWLRDLSNYCTQSPLACSMEIQHKRYKIGVLKCIMHIWWFSMRTDWGYLILERKEGMICSYSLHEGDVIRTLERYKEKRGESEFFCAVWRFQCGHNRAKNMNETQLFIYHYDLKQHIPICHKWHRR